MREKTPQNNKPAPFVHKKSLGQNFLTSDIVPKWLCDAAELVPREIVLEIGPGTGALTRELLARGTKVIAIEADERSVEYLKEHFKEALSAKNLILHHKDARNLNLSDYKLTNGQFKVVANIPYYLSGFLLRNLLESTIQPKTLVFLMQKELVERIARAKKESLLSLSVKVFGAPTYIRTVSRGHFNPAPKVDSAILRITDITKDKLKAVGNQLFFEILHIGLGSKRKQLLGNLSQAYKREEIVKIFTELNFSLTLRGEDLAPDDWINLVQALKTDTR